MKKASVLLAALLLSSCASVYPLEDENVTTTAPDMLSPASIESMIEWQTESDVPPEKTQELDPATLFNERIRKERLSFNGFFPDTDRWACEFATAVFPNRIFSRTLFEHEKGAMSSGYSDNCDVGYSIWTYDDIRIFLVYVIEDDLYTLSYAALADDGFIAPNGRELCRILNEDGRFGDFVYPEPQNGDDLLAMNLTEISRSAILKEFPNAENISYIQRQIVGVFNDGVILLYHYDLDGETRSCSVTLSIPSIMIDGKVTVTPGWPDDTSDLASESMIYDHYSAGYNEDGDLILRDLDNESEIVIDSRVADDSLSIQDYYVPRFWKFIEDGRLLYHINGWESYIGLGCYNIKTGDNTIYHCHSPCAVKGNTIYAASAYDEGDFTLYRLILDDNEYAEQKINLPEELSLDGECPVM